MTRMVYGVGINDADYKVSPRGPDGKQIWCKTYCIWRAMLERCYSERKLLKRPTYRGCTVVNEWHKFSNFRAWVLSQDHEGKQLDKDLLDRSNKVYGPDHCVFVTCAVNNFMTEHKVTKGDWPVGVHWADADKVFIASCCVAGSGSQYLGCFDNPEDASKVYQKFKRKLAIQLASVQTDSRIAEAILKNYPEV